MLRFMMTLVCACLLPALCFASGGEGGHGSLHFADIIEGEHSVEFWGAVVNFTLLLFVLRKLGKQPLSNFLSARRNEVETGIKEAAEVKAKAEAVFKEYSDRLKTMDADMEQLRRDIQEAAEADKKRILAEAEETTARLRKDTEALIEQHARELGDSVRLELVQAAMAAAEDMLRKALSPEDQLRLARQFQKDLGQTGDRA